MESISIELNVEHGQWKLIFDDRRTRDRVNRSVHFLKWIILVDLKKMNLVIKMMAEALQVELNQ